MKDLSKLVERFSKVLNKKTYTKEVVVEVMREYTGRSVLPEEVFLRGDVLEITSSPGIKSEIRLKEAKVLSGLKERGIHISRVLYK